MDRSFAGSPLLRPLYGHHLDAPAGPVRASITTAGSRRRPLRERLRNIRGSLLTELLLQASGATSVTRRNGLDS